ncbi:MAG: hypothetical protein GXZ11_04365 [Tissierellia bacterium]|nr:hypothetical protein [Tissierellia bacterium]
MKDKFRPQSIELWVAISWIILFILQVVNVSKGLAGNTMDSLVLTYDNLLVPHSIFSYLWWIMSVIFAIYLWHQFFQDEELVHYKLPFIRPMGLLLAIISILWLILFQLQLFLVALIFGLVTLALLFLINLQLRSRSLKKLSFIAYELPFSMGFGYAMFLWMENLWILLGTKIDNFSSSQLWSIIMLIIGFVLFMSIMIKFHNAFMGLGFTLGYLGILIRHFATWKAQYIAVVLVNIIICALLIYSIFQAVLYTKRKARHIIERRQY